MRFLAILLLAIVCAQAKKQPATEVKLDELIPNRLLNQLNDGWKKSLAVLQVSSSLTIIQMCTLGERHLLSLKNLWPSI
jgi:hypothetical protein